MTNRDENLRIANEISHQFRAALYMIGARDFLGVERGLQVTLPTSISKRIRKIQIILGTDDTYTIRGYTKKALETAEPTFSHEGVDVGEVRRMIEEETGLRTSL